MRATTRLPAFFLTLGLALLSREASAFEWELDVDGRLVSSNGQKSAMSGGLGELRFGESKSGVQLGRARLALSQPVGNVLALHLDASYWGDDDKSPVDVTEAYAEYRPYPIDGFRVRVRGGAFYAPISLENRAAGWESPYTLSSSAINNWIAEEVRTIGLETQAEWLGTRLGHSFDLSVVGAVYRWNDPIGGVLASKGFGISDRQTGLFGRVGMPGVAPLRGREPFHEIDGRTGYYGGLELRYLDRLTLRALHYDNRADPTAYDARLNDYAWQMKFDSAGARYESPGGWTLITQWLQGETYVDAPASEREWPFNARFFLISKRFGRHSLSARYDDFSIGFSINDFDLGEQTGHAWTLAYVAELTPNWRVTLEWVRVDSNLKPRSFYLGEAPGAIERGLQLAVRYAIGPGVR